MPCQHRVYKIFLFFLRNKIQILAKAKPQQLQGFSPTRFRTFPREYPRRTHSLSARQVFPDFPGKHLRRTRFVHIASPQARTFRTFLGKNLRRVFSKSNSFFRYCMFMECLANIFSPAGLLFTCKKRAKSCILYRLEEETHAACLKRFGARVFLSQKRNERSKDMDSVPDGKNTTKVKLHSLAFACFA